MRSAMAVALVCRVLVGHALAAQSSDSVATLTWRNIAGGAALIAVLATVDDPIAHAFRGASSTTTLSVARQFDRFGDATGAGPIIAGLAITGLLAHRRALLRTALQATASIALGTAVTQTGKYLIGRERPEGDPDLDGTDFRFLHGSPAFPSGHTTAAFALATSLSRAVHNPWATLGFYALATGTAWARMAEQRHWFTDVVAGAAVGTLSARVIDGQLRVLGIPAPRLLRVEFGTGVGWELSLPPHR